MVSAGRIAVALHDVEPATFDKCALIRDWLADQGIDRVTLLVIPAADAHPFYQRSPQLEHWLHERRAAGDAIAQHGFHHRPGRRGEFSGLRLNEAYDRVLAGRRLMALAGLAPTGFVAPAYAYTRGLRHALRYSFDWWASLLRCRTGGGYAVIPAVRASSRLLHSRPIGTAATIRLDLHPADFGSPRHVLALERAIARCEGRDAVTYDELLTA